MKRILPIVMALCLCLTLLAGCKDKEPEGSLTAGEWSVDLHEHWHEDADGKRTDVKAHDLNGSGACTVCGAEVTVNADGSGDVYVYGPDNAWTQAIYYDADGKVITVMRTDMTYDENGKLKTVKTTVDGRLAQEENHTYDESGTLVQVESVSYLENGAKEIYLYDGEDTVMGFTYYDADGSVTVEERYEHTRDTSGNIINDKTYSNGVLIREHDYAPDAGGMYVVVMTKEYHDDGTVTVTRYDLEGNVLEETTAQAPQTNNSSSGDGQGSGEQSGTANSTQGTIGNDPSDTGNQHNTVTTTPPVSDDTPSGSTDNPQTETPDATTTGTGGDPDNTTGTTQDPDFITDVIPGQNIMG